MIKAIKVAIATILAVLAFVVLAGCDGQSGQTYSYKAKVIGSGCSFGGCVTAVKIISGPYRMKTCRLEYVKIDVGDTVLVTINGDDSSVCNLQ